MLRSSVTFRVTSDIGGDVFASPAFKRRVRSFQRVGEGSGDGCKALTSADFLHGSPIVRADLAAGRAADAFHVLPVRTGAGFNQPRHCWTRDAGQRSELVVRQFFELEVLG